MQPDLWQAIVNDPLMWFATGICVGPYFVCHMHSSSESVHHQIKGISFNLFFFFFNRSMTSSSFLFRLDNPQ